MSDERARITFAALLALAALATGALLGRATAPAGNPADAGLRLLGGIPVGVARTPAGALAAADNYVALASQTVEQSPDAFAQLVAAAYAPSARALTLRQAAAIRAADPTGMRNYELGGRGRGGDRRAAPGPLHAGRRDRHDVARRVRVGPRGRAAPELEPRRDDPRLAGAAAGSCSPPTPPRRRRRSRPW